LVISILCDRRSAILSKTADLAGESDRRSPIDEKAAHFLPFLAS